MKRALATLLFSWLLTCAAYAGVPCTVPNIFINGTVADAGQVNANFQSVLTCLLNAAAAGNNTDITSLNGLSTPISPAQGGSNVYLGATSGGSPNAQTVNVITPTGYVQTNGYAVIFIAGASNTLNGTIGTTLNVAGTGQTAFYRQSPTGPQIMTGGELVAGQIVIAIYNSSDPSPPASQPTWNAGWYECVSCGGIQYGGFGPQTSIAAASSTNLGSIGGHNAIITGSSTITDFGSNGSLSLPMYFVGFTGTTTITFNNTNCSTVGGCIITPGGGNLVTAPGDTAWLLYLGNGSGSPTLGNWQVVFYAKANGTATINPTPLCGFSGLQWGNGTSSSTVTAGWQSANLLTSGQVSVFSPAQSGLTLNITLGTATSTAGGMDGHTPGNNSFVYMYAIYNGVTWSLVGSPSTTAGGVSLPIPGGAVPPYTYACYMGAIKTNGTGNLVGTQGRGRFANLVVGGANLTALPDYTAGTAGSGCGSATPTYASVIVQAPSGANVWVPVTATEAIISISGSYNGGSAASVLLAPNASYSGGASINPPPVAISAASSAQLARLNLESASVYWCSSATGGALLAYGWVDAVNAN